jgi:hypothetical protein
MKPIVQRLVSQQVIPQRDPDKLPQILLLQWKQELAQYETAFDVSHFMFVSEVFPVAGCGPRA